MTINSEGSLPPLPLGPGAPSSYSSSCHIIVPLLSFSLLSSSAKLLRTFAFFARYLQCRFKEIVLVHGFLSSRKEDIEPIGSSLRVRSRPMASLYIQSVTSSWDSCLCRRICSPSLILRSKTGRFLLSESQRVPTNYMYMEAIIYGIMDRRVRGGGAPSRPG
jgi:hypothetical protein